MSHGIVIYNSDILKFFVKNQDVEYLIHYFYDYCIILLFYNKFILFKNN
ncbi:hypothetical protein Zymop_0733 [Zymomonas mobilis subsp. pomaceae ATCC 29192]|uniref:Uncharacterized protein n=1 Tax=Zymomonas mobilis subsp. pomaceae (strain ATCC 29192 / DSM 22645 / JCM 10191 / CCUG 17912 / NBRC 13757 / NCIMB 11200 / NRRL B-4491 / Barker I) TaxID=579138 RepID=F8ES60_ZYMMT|nr:hypothetical protein Zymop_0733 [Zymomonas mobilis subsp. pomaceae ATCC 29192]